MLPVQEPLFRKQADHAQHVYVCARVCVCVGMQEHVHILSHYNDLCVVCYDFKSTCSW